MTEQLTGYEASSVAEIEAILDSSPADADTVYLDTIGYSERAIAAVAAKRAASGGSRPVFSRVHLSSGIPGTWDGSQIAFDVVDTDSTSLWDATNHQFVAKTAGWYAVACYTSTSIEESDNTHAGLRIDTSGADPGIEALVETQNGELADLYLPPLAGHMHLAEGDTLYVHGVFFANGNVGALTFFSLHLILAD